MITITDKIKSSIIGLNNSGKKKVIDYAWKLRLDKKLLSKILKNLEYNSDLNPWDGNHDTAREVIENELVIEAVMWHLGFNKKKR